MKTLPIAAVVVALGLGLGCDQNSDKADYPSGQGYSTDSATNVPVAKEADNTGRNVRDRSGDTLTPGDQGNSESDREITRTIRRALTENDLLSTTAKNIKIITVDGKVTLRGPVKSEQERQAIANAAHGAVLTTSIDNQLEVKPTAE